MTVLVRQVRVGSAKQNCIRLPFLQNHCTGSLHSTSSPAIMPSLRSCPNGLLTRDDGSSIDVNALSADEAPVLTGEEDIGRTELRRLADSADRGRRVVPLFHLVLVHGGRLERGPHGSRADRIDPNPLLEKLVRETSDHRDLGSLGHRVVDQHGWTGICHLRGSDDDAASFGDVWDSCSSEEERPVLPGQSEVSIEISREGASR